jgi:hypothetical protein
MKDGPAYWDFVFGLALAAGGAGTALGILTDEGYFLNDQSGDGWIAGLFLGLLTGVGYGFWMLRKDREEEPTTAYSAVSGIVAGLLCSLLTQIVLMIGYQDVSLWSIWVGALFGAEAGGFLGLAGGLILKSRRLSEAEAEELIHAAS